MNRLMQKTRLVAATASLAVATSLASAQTCDPQWLSSLGGAAIDVAIADDIAYVANFGGGLMVVDASDPTDPSILGSAPTGPTQNPTFSSAVGVALGNGLVYVADESGLRVIDATDPANPVVIGNLDTLDELTCDLNDVAIDGHIAYLAAFCTGVLVVDVSDPTDPILLATVAQPPVTGAFTYAVEAVDGMAYVAANSAGLQIIDATDPSNPLEVAVVSGTELLAARDVALQGGFAYVNGSSDLVIVDVSDPGAPVIVGDTDNPFQSFQFIAGVAVSGNKAYLSSSASGDTGTVTVVDVSDPSNPQIQGALGQYAPPNQGGSASGNTGRLAVADGVVWLADLSDDLAAIDVSDPNNLSVLGALPTPDGAEQTVLRGNLVYTRAGTRYYVVDVSDPSHPVELGNYREIGTSWGWDFKVDAGLLIATEGIFPATLRVLDVSDPQSLTNLSTLTLPNIAFRLDISGDIVCTTGASGLTVFDISTPSLPSIVGTLAGEFGEFGAVAINGDVVYIASAEDGLLVVDLSDPTDPTLIGSVPIEAVEIEAHDGFLFATTPSGLEVLNISIAEAPVQAGLLELPNLGRFVLDGPQAYAFGLSTESGVPPVALEIIDISDPAAPALFSTYQLPFFGGVGLDVQDGIVAIGADRQLQILDVATCVPGQCLADLDGDGQVSFDDLNLLLDQWGDSVPAGDGGDVTGDGAVNFDDLNFLLEYWGESCR